MQIYQFTYILIIVISFFLEADAFKRKQLNVPKRHGVFLLNETNFQIVQEEHHILFINFYKNNWTNLELFRPIFYKLALHMKNHFPEVKLGEVNIEKDPLLAERYQASNEFNLKLLINHTFQQQEINYEGDLIEEQMHSWLEKATSDVSEEITTYHELKKMKLENDILLFYFGEQETDDEFNEFKKAGIHFHDFKFGHTFSVDLREKVKAQPRQIVIYNNQEQQEGKKRIALKSEKINQHEIKKFIENHISSSVLDCNDTNRRKIFEPFTPTIFLFLKDSKSHKAKEMQYAFKIVSRNNKGNMLFFNVKESKNPECFAQTAEFLGVHDFEIPTIRILDLVNGDYQYFKMEGNITKKTLQQFIMKYRIKQIQPYLKSEPIIEQLQQHQATNDNRNGLIKKIVANNFKQEILDSQKDIVLLLINSKDCIYCQQALENLEQLAKLNINNQNIVFASFDTAKNEFRKFIHKVVKYPQILTYEIGKKNNPQIYMNYDQLDGLHATFKYLKVEKKIVDL